MQTVLSIDLIMTNPEVRNGQPCVAGAGLRVIAIAIAQLFHQRSPDEIAVDYELSLGQVHAALAYYYEHKGELDTESRRQSAGARQLKEQHVGVRHTFLPG